MPIVSDVKVTITYLEKTLGKTDPVCRIMRLFLNLVHLETRRVVFLSTAKDQAFQLMGNTVDLYKEQYPGQDIPGELEYVSIACINHDRPMSEDSTSRGTIRINDSTAHVADKYSSTVRGNVLDKVFIGLQKVLGFVQRVNLTPFAIFANLQLQHKWFCCEGDPWLNLVDLDVRLSGSYSGCN